MVEVKKEYDAKANPPLHSIIIMVSLIFFFLFLFPSMEHIDETAKVQVFTRRVFPEIVSLEMLVCIRAFFSVFVFSISMHAMIPGNGWEQVTSYLPSSRLRKAPILMHGVRTAMPFTSWSWIVLGLSNGLGAWVAYWGGLQGRPVSQPLLRVALLSFEVAAPASFLVSFVVTYVIWPNILRQGGSTKNISSLRTLIWHNGNVIMALTESSLLGGIPVILSHVPVFAFYGILYVLFGWMMRHHWSPGKGPQFIYFFFDTTLGKTTTMALLGLLTIMMIFYLIFCTAELVLAEILGGGLPAHIAYVLVICSGLCKFND